MGGRGASAFRQTSGMQGDFLTDNSVSDSMFKSFQKYSLKQAEQVISGYDYEMALMYDENGKLVGAYTDHDEASVGVTSDLLAKQGFTFTHNHPNGATFSQEDLTLLAYSLWKEIRAAGANETYTMTKQRYIPGSENIGTDYENAYKEWTKNTGDKIFEQAMNDLRHERIDFNEFNNRVDALNERCNQYRIQWLEENSSRYGFSFRREKT